MKKKPRKIETEHALKDEIRSCRTIGMNPDVKLFNNPVGYIEGIGRYGLRPGSSDLIGWRSVVITPEMVGKKIAIFAAVETKKPGGGVESEKQKNFIEQVIEAGGLAGFARSVPEAERILQIQ